MHESKITPFLWFNSNAEEAINFYVSLFKDSKITSTTCYDEEGAKASGQKKGSVMTIGFTLEGQEFSAINGGPYYSFSPAISFFVSCKTEKELDVLWKALSKNGTVLMELGAYPFSKKYGWLNDRFGVSWQLNLSQDTQKISPALLFVKEQFGKAEEAIKFYTSVFGNSKVNEIARYTKGEWDVEGKIKYAGFSLNGLGFKIMESSGPHNFNFNQSVSFVIHCKTQKEVDYFWNALSQGGQIVQCGWLCDKYGIPWQVVPIVLFKYLMDKDPKKAQNVMKAMLGMKKLDVKKLTEAYEA